MWTIRFERLKRTTQSKPGQCTKTSTTHFIIKSFWSNQLKNALKLWRSVKSDEAALHQN